MRYGKLAKALITSVLLGLTFVGVHAHASDSESEEDQHWAESVTDRQIDLGPEADESTDAKAEIQRISRYVQELKAEAVDLNHDLRQMEEQLLFPSSTKYSVFVSFSSGQFFSLESVRLKLNGRVVASHLYSEKEQEAMLRGGTHRLYVTNLSEGEHTATAFFTGIGPNGRAYKRATNINFEKSENSEYLELAIGDDQVKQEPVFAIKQW